MTFDGTMKQKTYFTRSMLQLNSSCLRIRENGTGLTRVTSDWTNPIKARPASIWPRRTQMSMRLFLLGHYEVAPWHCPAIPENLRARVRSTSDFSCTNHVFRIAPTSDYEGSAISINPVTEIYNLMIYERDSCLERNQLWWWIVPAGVVSCGIIILLVMTIVLPWAIIETLAGRGVDLESRLDAKDSF